MGTPREADIPEEEERRLWDLFCSGAFLHPYLSAEHFRSDIFAAGCESSFSSTHNNSREPLVANFTDLAAALASCCGAEIPPLSPPFSHRLGGASVMSTEQIGAMGDAIHQERRVQLINEIGGSNRRHIIFVLCDGMGNSILDRHLGDRSNDHTGGDSDKSHRESARNRDGCDDSFLLAHNDRARLRAVFPSTTPAALTTLATAAWPGRHGVPGWDLRDQRGCDFPGQLAEGPPVQLRILAKRVTDVRSGEDAALVGFGSLDDVFIVEPWARKVSSNGKQDGNGRLGVDADSTAVGASTTKRITSCGTDEGEGGGVYNERVGISLSRCSGDGRVVRVRGEPRKCTSSHSVAHSSPCRRMVYINAYNGDDFPNWYQGSSRCDLSKKSKNIDPNGVADVQSATPSCSSKMSGTDFSSWQMGQQETGNESEVNVGTQTGDRRCKDYRKWFHAATIEETSYETLGKPEGSSDAVKYFHAGVDAALQAVSDAEARGESSFVYLYTAHPDKHMHALGVEHPEVGHVVRGIDAELERLWTSLADGTAEALVGKDSTWTVSEEASCLGRADGTLNGSHRRLDATLIVTADHGHVTVCPDEMVVLPPDIVECLEYANLGVHGKGRHAYLHCRAGLQATLRQRWRTAPNNFSNLFLLLSIDEASRNGLFGPRQPDVRVRPRFGDFVAIATGRHTLVSPQEAEKYRDAAAPICQGAHGSLLSEEMSIPFVLCSPGSS